MNAAEKIMYIYAILMTERLEPDKGGRPEFGMTDLAGFYINYEDAEWAVKNNCADIHDNLFDYAIIEKVSEGLYCTLMERWFFQYNHDSDGYIQIEEPSFLKHYANLTFGFPVVGAS